MSMTDICPVCKTGYSELPEKCVKCAYPIAGTKQEQGKFIGKSIRMKHTHKTTQKLEKVFRIIFFVIACINIIFLFRLSPDSYYFVHKAALSVLFGAAGVITIKQPFIGILLALLLYIIAIVLLAFIEPNLAFSGIILKLFLIGGMGYCFYNRVQLNNYNRDNPGVFQHDENI